MSYVTGEKCVLSEALEHKKNYDRPLPELTPLSRPFWEYAKSHELRMQFCNNCSNWIWYPKAWCPICGVRNSLEWRKLSGRGSVYSFTIIRQVIDNSPSFQSEIPFVIGLIELEEGPRIYSNITGMKIESLKIGDKVSVYFEDVSDEIALPKFKKS